MSELKNTRQKHTKSQTDRDMDMLYTVPYIKKLHYRPTAMLSVIDAKAKLVDTPPPRVKFTIFTLCLSV